MLGLLLFINMPKAAAAGADFNLTTSPLPLDLVVKPGHTVTTDLRVQNSSTAVANIKVSLLKFKANGQNGNPELLPRQPGDSFFDWVSFSRSSFTAQPGQWNDVQVTINAPSSAAFGYYYAILFSNANDDQSATKPNSTSLSGAVATLVLLDVQAPGEKRQLGVDNFSVGKKLYEYLPVNFAVKVHNSGNVHGIPSGSIFITKGKSTVAVLDINPGGGNVLPDSNRSFNVTWNDGFPVFTQKIDHGELVSNNKSQPVYTLSWNFANTGKFRFGHYNAHLLLTYDNGTSDVPVEANVAFWVIPWKLGLILLAILLIVGFGLFTLIRSLYRRGGSVATRIKKNRKSRF